MNLAERRLVLIKSILETKDFFTCEQFSNILVKRIKDDILNSNKLPVDKTLLLDEFNRNTLYIYIY